MKTINFFAAFLLFIFHSFLANSQADITPTGLINPSFGLNGGDIYANQITTTNDGYTYTAGKFANTVDFDLTQDTFNISSTYLYNMFIAKYDKQSRLVFAFKLSGLSGFDDITAITTDKEDNIYVTGFFAETVDFDPGPGTANLSTPNYYTYYMFFAKYDKNGNYIFVKPIVTTLDINSLPQINSIKADINENIFIAGYGKTQHLDFDPGIGVAHPENYGRDDAFFAKYDASGDYVFVKAVGSDLDDECESIAVNKNKDIIIAGSFADSTNDFDPNKGKVSLFFRGGNSDAFIAIYDSSGNYKYAFSFGGTKGDYVSGIVTDDDSNIIVAGSFFGNVDFAPDSSVVKRTSDADNDNFLAKYTSTGKVIFVTTVHSDGHAFYSLVLDSNNNIYAGGQFNRSVVFTLTDSLVCTSGYDGLLAKYSSKGIYIFSCQQVTHNMFPWPVNIALRSNNQVCISSNFDSTAYFGSIKISTQNHNCYIAVYNSSGTVLSANAFGTYRAFVVESAVIKMTHDEQGNTYVAGTFQGIVDFDPGIGQYILTSSQDASTRSLSTELTDDIFFAKYSSAGKLIFAKDLGGTEGQAPISIAVDANHNIYLAGTFADKMDADPGKGRVVLKRQHNASLYQSYFIGKYDSLGNYIFAKPIYVSGDLHAFTIDKKNNLYIAGMFGSGYFDPSNDTNKISVNGDYIFFAKYNNDGNFIYLKSIGQKNTTQFSYDIAINSKNNVIICGEIKGSQIDFDPGPNTFYANSGSSYAHFVAAYTTNGDFLFESNGQSLNSSSSSDARLLKIDTRDNIILEGYLRGNIKIDSRFDSLISSDNGGLYFIKYSSTGIPLFIKTLSASNSSEDLYLESLALDNANNIYIAGEFYGKVDFDAGPDTAYLISQTTMHSGTNAYLAKYDSLGNYEFAYNFAPTDTSFNRGIYKMDLYVNKNAEITWGLNTNGSIDFYPGPDTFFYHPPFDYYPTQNQSYSFVLVKFKQKQINAPFKIYALLPKPALLPKYKNSFD